MRAFAIGLVVGTGLCFLAMRFIYPPAAPEAVNQQVVVRSTPVEIPPAAAPSCPEVTTVSAPTPQIDEKKTLETRPAVRDTVNAQPESIVVTKAVRRRVSIDDFTDEEATSLCAQMYTRQQQRERAVKDAEPVDIGWAYPMEQLMRQHLESRLSSDQYSALKVECRTTFCELNMAGVGTDNREQAQKLANEIAGQPWSDVVGKGNSSTGGSGDTWSIAYEWFRPRTDAEKRIWQRPKN